MEKLQELNQKYELKLDSIINKIKKKNAKNILIQLPDGFKIYATELVDYLYGKINKNIFISIWLGSCFGACDIPKTNVDLIIQFGHAPWK